jgi:hypothetical protein
MITAEIFNCLMALKNRQMFFSQDDEDSFNSTMYDVGKALGLSDTQCSKLADDELPGDLITITEAASMLRVTTNAISNRIARWEIPAYRDDTENNPRKSQRVSRKDIDNIMTQPAKTIQHELASSYRETTGNIPSGQLWQECDNSGCDNEPVCMNCFKCQSRHCKC